MAITKRPRPTATARRLEVSVERSRERLAPLTAEAIGEVMRRGTGAVRADGYASNTRLDVARGRPSLQVDIGAGQVDTVELSSTVEAAAFARQSDTRSDPVGQAALRFVRLIGDIYRMTEELHRVHDVVMHAADSHVGRVSSLAGTCQACETAVAGTPGDRLRSGWCPACYAALRTWRERNSLGDDPGALRARFVAWRMDRLAQQGASSRRLQPPRDVRPPPNGGA